MLLISAANGNKHRNLMQNKILYYQSLPSVTYIQIYKYKNIFEVHVNFLLVDMSEKLCQTNTLPNILNIKKNEKLNFTFYFLLLGFLPRWFRGSIVEVDGKRNP